MVGGGISEYYREEAGGGAGDIMEKDEYTKYSAQTCNSIQQVNEE